LLASCAGLALTLPFASWLFLPGKWCAASPGCRASYPDFRFDDRAAWWMVLALASLGLQLVQARRGMC
jgi:hypothetical protein